MEVSGYVGIWILEKIDLLRRGIDADKLVPDTVRSVEVSVCALPDRTAQCSTVGNRLRDTGQFDWRWIQGGSEGDGIFVNLACIGVDTEDDVFENALE